MVIQFKILFTITEAIVIVRFVQHGVLDLLIAPDSMAARLAAHWLKGSSKLMALIIPMAVKL